MKAAEQSMILQEIADMVYEHLRVDAVVHDGQEPYLQVTDAATVQLNGMDVVVHSQWDAQPFALEHPRCFAHVIARLSQLTDGRH